MFKKILKWVISSVFVVSTIYYAVCKITKKNNAFTQLIDVIIKFIGVALNFIAQHIIPILIVIGVVIVFSLIYLYIVKHHNSDF